MAEIKIVGASQRSQSSEDGEFPCGLTEQDMDVSPTESLLLEEDLIIILDNDQSPYEQDLPPPNLHDDLDSSPFDPPDHKHSVALSPDRDSKRLRLESEESTLVDKESFPKDTQSASLDSSFASDGPILHPDSPTRQIVSPAVEEPFKGPHKEPQESQKDMEIEPVAVPHSPIPVVPELPTFQKDALSEKVYHAQIMQIIKSGGELMDALDILKEINYLGLPCPMDLCWLLIQEGGFKRDPGIIHGVCLHLASFDIPLSPGEYAVVLLQFIYSSSTSHFQATLTHFMTTHGSILKLNMVALWKAAYVSASIEILQSLLSAYCTIQNPSNINHSILNMMMSHLLKLNMTLDILKLMDKIKDWKSLVLVLDQTCLLSLGHALMAMKEYERVFGIVQILTVPGVHDLLMALFQAIYTKARFETLSEEVWVLFNLSRRFSTGLLIHWS